MTDFVKYLEGVKAKLGISSDRQFAGQIGVSQSFMSNMMAGWQVPEDDTCIKIAKLAGDNPERIILLARKSKASDTSRPYWEHIFALLTEPKKAAVTASLAFLLIIPMIFQETFPGTTDFSLQNTYRNISYATLSM